MKFKAALDLVKAKRSSVNPNPDFLEQLEQWSKDREEHVSKN